MSTLDNLRKAAKRWLRALRDERDPRNADARARLERAYPNAPAEPGLRDVQHALAREHGHESWVALKEDVGRRQSAGPGQVADEPTGGRTHSDRVATFLEFACWDHHVHGKGDHRMYDHAARRLLSQHPEIATDSLSTAVVCGELDEVERILAERPEAAREPGGSRGWQPLLYLCFTRFTNAATIENAVPTARALLDRGADPNAYYMAGDSRYTALVGVAGEGEQDSPRQPQAKALYQLLLERGAGPYDIQVLYNTHFSGDMLWWLRMTYEHSVKIGRKADWDDPDWRMLDMGGYGPGAHFVLRAAVEKNNLELAEWALSHGATPHLATSSHAKFKPQLTHYQEAMGRGYTELADLFVRHGATPAPPAMGEEEAFIAACLRLDRDDVRARVALHPEYLRSHKALFAAARLDRPDVMAFLLDLGVPIEVEDEHHQRALHEAAGHGALAAAKLLIERGAEIDPRETNYGSTPIGFASYGDDVRMVEFLSQYSKNVWTLSYRGYVDRLREILRVEPQLARAVTKDGITPLWWLPDDEAVALEIVNLLMSCGADPSIKSSEGTTAADWARKRGMADVARKLAVPGAVTPPRPPKPDLEKYEQLAQDLLFAYETGHEAAMKRLQDHYDRPMTWQELRAGVRQRLAALGAERPDEYFAVRHAKELVARGAGFQNWAELVQLIAPDRPIHGGAAPSAPRPQPPDPSVADIQPIEMCTTLPMRLHDGTVTTTTNVWDMLTATRRGDLERVKELVAACPALVLCDYNYMPPLHLAVREGHDELVRYLAEQGAVNPKYVTYPYKETLVTLARDRGYDEIAHLLEEYSRTSDPARPEEEGGEIDYGMDEERRRFQKLVNINALVEVERMLTIRPELALNEFAFWSEGVLMMPANRGNRKMLELLIRFGARVPDVTKWGRAYYFKRYDIAVFLMSGGMNPNHMNCHRTTLLHDMAQEGDRQKAQLLLDHGADLDAVDEEFRSTPLGLAARWGHRDMVGFLLERGADPNRSGAPWATPLAWAQKKGHTRVERDLRQAGA